MLETLDYTIHIGSTPTFLYFDLYLYSAYAAHYVVLNVRFKSCYDIPLILTILGEGGMDELGELSVEERETTSTV